MSTLKSMMLDHAWALAIGCICSCYIITGIQVYKHLLNYTNSYWQNKIISKYAKVI